MRLRRGRAGRSRRAPSWSRTGRREGSRRARRRGSPPARAQRTMHILGIGTDIIECPRIGRMIEQHGELFLRRVYTEREIRYCQARKHAIEHFAGRWAAKEAILKAIGTGWIRGIAWTDIEVRNGGGGQPLVLVCGGAKEAALKRGIGDILVSIS